MLAAAAPSPSGNTFAAGQRNRNTQKELRRRSGIMECFVQGLEHSMDVLNCSFHPRQDFNIDGSGISDDPSNQNYAQLHDDCLESLLQEQKQIQREMRRNSLSEIPVVEQSASLSSFDAIRKSDLTSREIPRSRSLLSEERRIIKLPRRGSMKRSSSMLILRNQTIDSDTCSVMSGRTEDSSIATPYDRELPDAIAFIHAKCRLQKDKGKGAPLGSQICANGRAECVRKLRQKMEVLTRVSMASKEKKKKGTASMKRKNAKVTEVTPTYTETRSVISLKMGFLSMTYGVLLRWDTVFTGKVVLVVLRKMCHDSFYRKPLVMKTITGSKMKEVTPILVTRDNGGEIVILQRIYGTEVTPLEPPFRVLRPAEFHPSKLSISVVRFDGFNSKSTWTMIVIFDEVAQKIQQKDGMFEKENTMEWEVSAHRTDFEFQVVMYEQKRSRSKRKRIISRKTMYLNFLDVARVPQSQQLEFPCLSHGKVVMNVRHKSDYANWLYKELAARKEEESHNSWITPFYPVFVDDTIAGKKDCESLWERCCFGCT